MRYLVRRLLWTLAALLGVSLLIFVLARLIPGTIIEVTTGIEGQLSAQQRLDLLRSFGLDRPLPVQYALWLWNMLQGNFGWSFRTSQPVAGLLVSRLPITVELAVLTVICVTPWQDLPVNLEQMFLPVISLALGLAAVVLRMTRSSMLEVLGQDYVRVAQAKGLSDSIVLLRHALRNALIPIVTVLGLQMGTLLGGVVITEQIFGLPGLGWTLLNGVYQRDYPVVQGAVMLFAVLFVLTNFFVDLTYTYLDPRIRFE